MFCFRFVCVSNNIYFTEAKEKNMLDIFCFHLRCRTTFDVSDSQPRIYVITPKKHYTDADSPIQRQHKTFSKISFLIGHACVDTNQSYSISHLTGHLPTHEQNYQFVNEFVNERINRSTVVSFSELFVNRNRVC